MPAIVILCTAWLLGALVALWANASARSGAPAFGAVTLSLLAALCLTAAGVLTARLVWAGARADALEPQAHRTQRAAQEVVLAAVVLSLGALLIANSTWRRRAVCADAISASDGILLAALTDNAAPKSRVGATVRAPRGPLTGCSASGTLLVTSGQAVAGSWVRVRAARVTNTYRIGAKSELRVVDAQIEPTGAVDQLLGWRGRTGVTIDSLFGVNAPLVRALLVADQHGIDPDVRDRFASAGLVHLLSISGLHVAIIAAAFRTVAQALRLHRVHSGQLAIAGVAVYVALLGFPPPSTRAAVMLMVIMVSDRLGRPVHPWTALAVGITAPTFDPTVVASLGWQLSAAGMAALVGARGIIRRWRTLPLVYARPTGSWSRMALRIRRAGPRLSGWRLSLVSELLVGTIACLATLPLTAWAFGRMSLIAPLSNIVAAPLVAVLQPALFLALLLAPLGAVAQFVADGAGLPMIALDYLARLASAIPYAALDVAPGRATALCMGVAALAFLVGTARRRTGPPLLVASVVLTLALWLPVLSRGPGMLELHMVDVGQGDALALRTPRGRWILVDAGRVWQGGDAGRRTVVPYIGRIGGTVALFVLTHPDADHVGGAPSVLRLLSPGAWWDPGFVHTSDVYRDALSAAQEGGIPWHRAQAGDSLVLDGVLLRVLAPDSLWTERLQSANDASVVLMVQYGGVRMLLTGDAEIAEEGWLVDQWGDALQAQVLKVGHHGSKTSTTERLLRAVRPELALVSVGADNRYGHPSPVVLDRLRAHHVDILRTDRDGAIVLRTNGSAIFLETRHTQWQHQLLR